jgi:hypothetical protein
LLDLVIFTCIGERISTTPDLTRSTTLLDRSVSLPLLPFSSLSPHAARPTLFLVLPYLPSSQILLARRLGKDTIIAETGAGQHGVATATACARFGMKCKIYMGEEDVRRQALNVFRIKMLGAEVRSASSSFPSWWQA